MCLDCGYLLPASPLEEIPVTTETLSPQEDSNHTADVSVIESAPELAPSARPAIINHRASSHYRQRLAQRQQQLDQPELPAAPDEPLLETAPEPAPTLIAPPPPARIEPESATNETPANLPTHQSDPPLVLPPLSSDDAQLLADSQAEVAEKPTAHQAAIAKADQLLAAADNSPKKTTKHAPLRNWLMLSATVILLVVSASVFANALHKTTTTPTPTITASSTPTAQASSDAIKHDSKRKADLNSIAIGLEAYKKNTGAYPVGSDISVLYPLQKTAPPYITDIPNDPLTSKDEQAAALRYGYSSDGVTFTLTAVLENKQDSDGKDGLYTVKNTP